MSIMIIGIILAVSIAVFIFLNVFGSKKDRKDVIKENTDVQYNYSKFEIDILDLVNKHRASLGLSQLLKNDYISTKCEEHSRYMFENNKASHDYFSIREQEIIDSLEVKSVGENIAYNLSTAEAVLNAWLQSPKHKENLENPNWKLFGISTIDKFTTNIFTQ